LDHKTVRVHTNPIVDTCTLTRWVSCPGQISDILLFWGRSLKYAKRVSTEVSGAELEARRLAVDNALGSLRIENMEVDLVPRRILELYAKGRISLEEMNRAVHAYTATIV